MIPGSYKGLVTESEQPDTITSNLSNKFATLASEKEPDEESHESSNQEPSDQDISYDSSSKSSHSKTTNVSHQESDHSKSVENEKGYDESFDGIDKDNCNMILHISVVEKLGGFNSSSNSFLRQNDSKK